MFRTDQMGLLKEWRDDSTASEAWMSCSQPLNKRWSLDVMFLGWQKSVDSNTLENTGI